MKARAKTFCGVVLAVAILAIAGCATPTTSDYTAFRTANPRSILIVPVLNDSTQVDAPDYFLATVSKPFAERGFYVFPANMVKRVLEESGLSDAALVHNANPRRLATLFGCDSVLLVEIKQWQSQYVILSTQTTVEFQYDLKSCRSGLTLWKNDEKMTYSPQSSSAVNPLAALIADSIVAAIEKADPKYIPLTQQANLAAASTPGRGLPAGPYSPDYGRDADAFPGAAH